jgi:hypothetical protein
MCGTIVGGKVKYGNRYLNIFWKKPVIRYVISGAIRRNFYSPFLGKILVNFNLFFLLGLPRSPLLRTFSANVKCKFLVSHFQLFPEKF